MTTSTRRPSESADGARLGPAQRDEVIRRHMRMAERIAGQYAGRRLELDELESVAYLALVDAADRYDVAGFPEDSFARYATRVIRSHLRDALAKAPIVPMSRDHERAALRRGDAAPGWMPYGYAVDRLGMAPRRDDRAEALAEALAECTDAEQELVRLMYADGLTVLQAGRRMGLGRSESRSVYRGAMAGLESAFRRRGFDLPATATATN